MKWAAGSTNANVRVLLSRAPMCGRDLTSCSYSLHEFTCEYGVCQSSAPLSVVCGVRAVYVCVCEKAVHVCVVCVRAVHM